MKVSIELERTKSWEWVICALLLAGFAILSASASATKGPTYDEPLHVAGGIIQRSAGDYRVNPEDPPLFGWFAAVLVPTPISDGYDASPYWPAMLRDIAAPHWPFAINMLFRNDGVDGAALIGRARWTFVAVGVLLGVLIAAWSSRLGGGSAMITATLLYSFDPNFIAHSGLVKNDVAISLLLLAMAMSVWRFGQTGSIHSLAAIACICILAVNFKFSGILFLPILAVLLAIRALMPLSWTVARMELKSRLQRIILVLAICLGLGAVCGASIWATYRFRFGPTNNPAERVDTRPIVARIQHNRIVARTEGQTKISAEMITNEPPGRLANLLIWAQEHRLLPQAWIAGFLYTYACSLYRETYLLGEAGLVGWWYYFPLAMLFKTPIATWLAMLSALAIGSGLIARRRLRELKVFWAAICLFAPFLIYLLIAMSSNLNIGLRHVLPIYPLMYVAAGALLAAGLRRWHTPMVKALTVMGLLLAIETALSWPNYIPFFNFAVGGSRGGIDLLGDSNLDWGQDLPLVKQWQDQHPDIPLAFGPLYTDPGSGSYFGTVPPEFYGIRAVPLPPGTPSAELSNTHVLAVSATMLQDIYVDGYEGYHHYKPIAILGGTIYLYDLRPEKSGKPMR